MTQALIFANGDVFDGPMVRRAIADTTNPLIVAADGGARIAWYYHFVVHAVVGDMDSLTPEELAVLVGLGAEVVRHPPEKDFTDLELALKYASEQDVDWMRVVGGIGDRLDQTFANVYLLALPELHGRDVRLVAGKQEIRLLMPGEYRISGEKGDTISLIPMGGPVRGILTENLYYPLNDEALKFGPARGISNVMTSTEAQVSHQEGTLMLVHTIGRA
ncbi:MAG: thiamine diphosphokinase [Anaerolineae bacterium]